MSDPPIDIPPPADVQAGPSDGARADVNTEAERERAKLEAAILKFNTTCNPLVGPPQGRDLPRLVSPVNRRAGTLPILPLGLMEEVQPRHRAKEGARLISLVCSNSYLD